MASSDRTLLYSYWRSSCSWRVRIALAHKGIAYEYSATHLVKKEQRSEDYAALNPSKLVPTLLIDGHTLTQSIAILEYLEETRPEASMLPTEPKARADVRAIVQIIASDTQPLQNLRVLEYIGDEKKAEWAKHWISASFDALEQVLSRTAGRYCVGDCVTFADACLVPQVYNAHRFSVDMSAYPTIVRVEAALRELPAFVAAHPDQQPDKQ
eukprot:Amastigsp_a847809_21.p2 type:complete len:211 gc:universal Amastigsp_a847809_21:638-6(-)